MADPYDTPGYRYSVNEFPGDGTTTDWSIQFSGRHPGYISIDHVRASIIAPNGTETLVSLSQENFVLPTLLRITPAVPAGSVLRVWRDTPKSEPLLNYNDGALLTERNLDQSFEQAVYAAAEMVDRSAESLADVEEFADAVLTRLGQVEDVADTALNTSVLALNTSNTALTAAQEAVSTSNAALAGVEGATEAAILATDAANAANSAATLATTAANNATTAATDALATSQEAVDTATDALDVASGIAGTANNALTVANDAMDVANGIAGTANTALSAANDAVITANNAEAMANAILDKDSSTKGAAMLWYLPVDGGVPQTIASRLTEFVGVHQYFRPPDADYSNAFERALAASKKVYFDSAYGEFDLVGTFELPSNREIHFIGNPTLNITVNGGNRGIWWKEGVERTKVFGDAYVRLRTDTAGSDGSYNGAFTFGQFYYLDDPRPIRNCGIDGNITIECVGSANSKPVSIYGWVEDCYFGNIIGTGRTNYAFSAHWSSNGAPGLLPTKTWHPHRLHVKGAKIRPTPGQVGQTLRAFTFSACGKVVLEDCDSTDVSTLGYNLFVGDYGYTYAQNISQDEAFDFNLVRCRHSGLATGMSVDTQSAGLNGSPIWSGSDHNARLRVDGLDIFIGVAATSTVGLAVTLLKNIDVRGLRIIEQGTTNATQPLTLFGIGGGEIRGQVVSRFGGLVRACSDLNLTNLPVTSKLPEPDLARYGLSVPATSSVGTVTATVPAGGTSISLTGVTLVTGPGGVPSIQ